MAGIKLYIGADSRGLRKGLADNNRLIGRWITGVVRKMSRAGLRMGAALTRGMITSVKRLGFVAGGLIAGGIVKSVKESARFEDYGVQFEALLGSVEAAKKRMQEIKEVDLNVPFDITSIADASRILQVFTNGAFASTEALTMMADAASVTPNDIKDVAFWYGRAYSMIQSGRPFGEAAMRLQEMGLLSGEARNEMERLGKTKGPQRIERMMATLDAEFRKFEGAALKRAKTFNGIWSIFTSATKQAFAEVGDAILPLAKTWLKELIDKINELRNNGTLNRWGQGASKALASIRNKIEKDVIPALARFKSAFSEGNEEGDLLKGIENVAREVGDVISKSIKDQLPDIVKSGVEIGAALARGIADGIDRNMSDKFWWWVLKQPGELKEKVGELVSTRQDIKAQREINRKRDIDLGMGILNRTANQSQLQSLPQGVRERMAIDLATKAYNNPQWYMDVMKGGMPVYIVNKTEAAP